MDMTRRGIRARALQPDQYFVGVDLGQTTDPTAICVIRKTRLRARECAEGEPDHSRYRHELLHIERLRLGTPYPDQAAYVSELLQREPLCSHQTKLVIDQTGVGRAVFDIFKHSGLKPYGVTITAGDEARTTGDSWRVPKTALVSRLQSEFHMGRLRISGALKDSGALVRELQAFRVSFTSAGNAVFGARSGAHDDMVLALAIAVWFSAEWRPRVAVSQV